jgi:hypothetical protein
MFVHCFKLATHYTGVCLNIKQFYLFVLLPYISRLVMLYIVCSYLLLLLLGEPLFVGIFKKNSIINRLS